jgi:hypothetical protein
MPDSSTVSASYESLQFSAQVLSLCPFPPPALVQSSWRRGLLEFRPGRTGVHGPTLSIIWMLSLALFVLRQVRFWAKKWPLAISIAAWLLYVALVYLRTVP